MASTDRRSSWENLFALRRDPFDLFARLVEEHGRERALIPIDTGRAQPLSLVTDPEIVREVLVSRAAEFGKWFHTTLSTELLAGGLIVSEGGAYRQMRRMSQPAFHRQHLPHYAAQTVAVGAAECDLWPPDTVFDLEPTLLRLTTRVTSRLFFGEDLAATDALERLCAAMETILSVFGAFVLPAAERTPYKAAWSGVQGVLESLAATRQDPVAPAAASPDLLGLLLTARWEDGQPLSLPELTDQAPARFSLPGRTRPRRRCSGRFTCWPPTRPRKRRSSRRSTPCPRKSPSRKSGG